MTVRKTAEGRTISGFKMKLYPGFAEEYERRHNELWPEMADMLHEYGGHNYSIFIDEETNILFGYIELDDPERYAESAETEICRKWWAFTWISTQLGGIAEMVIGGTPQDPLHINR